jgi:hypothetical protein
MITPAYRRSIRDIKEALRGLLPLYKVGLRFTVPWEAHPLDEFGQPMGSTVTGQEDADFETLPEGTVTDASMGPELLTERLTTSADAKAS